MTIEQIYRHLRYDLWDQMESGKDWFSIGSSAPLDDNGHGIVVWCDEDEDGKYFDITIRENYSQDDWGDTLDVLEECTSDGTFETLESDVIKLLKEFYDIKEEN